MGAGLVFCCMFWCARRRQVYLFRIDERCRMARCLFESLLARMGYGLVHTHLATGTSLSTLIKISLYSMFRKDETQCVACVAFVVQNCFNKDLFLVATCRRSNGSSMRWLRLPSDMCYGPSYLLSYKIYIGWGEFWTCLGVLHYVWEMFWGI